MSNNPSEREYLDEVARLRREALAGANTLKQRVDIIDFCDQLIENRHGGLPLPNGEGIISDSTRRASRGGPLNLR